MSADTVVTPEQRRLYENFFFPLRFDLLLAQVSSPGILSNPQIAIIRARCAGASYVKIQKKVFLCNEEAVSRGRPDADQRSPHSESARLTHAKQDICHPMF
jgi:hypothetical protein